jgi:hypothetical protein
MNKSIFNTAVAVVVAAVFCVGCGGGGGSKPASLTGQWVDVNPKPGDSEEFELFSDGTAAFKNGDLSVSGTWNIIDKRFVVTVSVAGTSMSEAYNYKLSGYELTLVNDKGDTSTCVKKEKLGDFKEKQAKANAEKMEALVGKWVYMHVKCFDGLNGRTCENPISNIELLKDGKGIIEDGAESVSWDIDGNLLEIGRRSFDYKLSGYELTIIDDDDDTSTFVRKEKLDEYKAKQAKAK